MSPNVLGPPSITSKPTTGPGSDQRDPSPVAVPTMRGGSPVVLTCAADADPPARYTWSRRNSSANNSWEPVFDGEHYKLLQNGSLQITPNTLLVGGLYGLENVIVTIDSLLCFQE